MEKITGFLFLFIVLFLFYSYFSLKKQEKNKNKPLKIKEGEEKKENDIYEKHIISAVIASLMDGKKYKIRTIFKEKEKNTAGEKSAWKIAGRNYNMQRRERI